MVKMIKTSSGLGRSLVRRLCYRLSVCLAASTFCLVSFGFEPEDLTPGQLRIYTFSSVTSLTDYDSSFVSVMPDSLSADLDALSLYGSRTFGLVFNSNNIISFPSSSTTTTNSTFTPTTPFRCTWSNTNSRVFVSPYAWPSVRRLFDLCVGLYNSGYRGPGAVAVNTKNSPIAVNFNFPVLVSDILSSTNSIYRQQLLSRLSQMNNLIVNIDSNVSSLSPQVEEIRDINSSILSILTASHSNSLDNSSLALSSNIVSLARFVNTNPFVADFTNAVSSLANVSGDFPQGDVDYLLNTYAGLDPFTRSVFALQVSDEFHNLNFMDTFKRNFSGDVFNASVVDALIGDYPAEESKRGAKASDSVRTSIKAQLQAWRNEAKQQLNDWKSDLKSDLQSWKTSDETGYLNVKKSIDDNFAYTERGRTNQLPFTAFQTNFVMRPLTNIIYKSAADVQSNATANADKQIEAAEDRWQEFKDLTTGSGEGLNVRIKFPLWETDGYHVNVRDDAVVSAIQDLHVVPDELTSIKDNIQWFKDGGPMNVDLPTNLVEMLDQILDAITNRPDKSYLLLDDYAVYITNGVYQSSIEQFQEDFPNVYTNLQKYGLNSSGDGNFWTLFGANLIYQSGLIGSLLEDMATIRKFADDHIEGGFAAGIKSIVEKFPSATQLEDNVNSSTGRVYEISLASTNLVLNFESVTNIAPSVFRPFANSFDSPPSGDIVFFKTVNDKYVSIPVHAQSSVWSLIRRGIAFALVGVQFLLFPRFVLMIVLLFGKLSNRFVKFVPTDR